MDRCRLCGVRTNDSSISEPRYEQAWFVTSRVPRGVHEFWPRVPGSAKCIIEVEVMGMFRSDWQFVADGNSVVAATSSVGLQYPAETNGYFFKSLVQLTFFNNNMKRTPRKLIVLTYLLLLAQFCHGWSHPNSCGDGPQERQRASSTPSSYPSSPLAPSSASGSTSKSSVSSSFSSSSSGGEDNSRTCVCSRLQTLVAVSSVSTARVSMSNGTASDIVQQLYNHYQAGDDVDQTVLRVVPEAVQARLEYLSVTFEDLPGLIQRAVLWDSGFAVTSDNHAIRIWTIDNRSMADLAVSVDEFKAAGCEALSCTQSNGEVAQMYSTCSQGPFQMLAASKCVVEAFESDEESNATMWSTGGDSSSIPGIRVVKNSGLSECGCEYTVYSIHTGTSSEGMSTAAKCTVGDWSGSLVIPCYGNDSVPDSITPRITTPQETDWVTGWILEHGKSSTTSGSSGLPSQSSASATTETEKENGGGFSLWWLLLILLIILLLIIATIVACRHCHRLSHFNAPPDNTTYIFVGGRMWVVEDETHGRGAGYWLRFAIWCRKTFNFFG